MRLVIGGPARDTVPARFALDLATLYAYTTRWAWDANSVYLRFVGSTYVHVGREAVLSEAQQIGATHLLWLDTDMTFPEDTAWRLVQRRKPVVGCNCLMRDPRQIWTAQRDGQRLATTAESTGLEAVDSVGLAVLLMRLDVVADLPRPYFTHGRNDSGGDIGEDMMFCRALKAAGHTIWIDHDLSKEIGHIGQYTYRPAVVDQPSVAV